jgi:hypothetical protein
MDDPVTDEKVELQCPRCRGRRTWYRKKLAAPGHCECGAWAWWKVWRPRPPNTPRGYVIVHGHLGKQELTGPGWQEHPDRWQPE